jgi:glycine dehydrogenase subunit 2
MISSSQNSSPENSSRENLTPLMRKTTSHSVVLEEETLFVRSRKGARAAALAAWDVPKVDPKSYFGSANRQGENKLPELSEPEVVRHFTRLSTWNYAIDLGIYPLGSCTMKYNPRLNEEVARSAPLGDAHPYDPPEWLQGHFQLMYELQEDLKEVTGHPGVSLQPAAGAHGELTGLMMISAYHKAKGKARKTIITADTAHGTNPASAALAGFQIVQVSTGADGSVSPDAVAAVLNDDVAALMVTNPNTLGVFEKHIKTIADMLHAKDALLYIDGANLNAVLGLARPGDYGVDVIQFNLHKTFSTPHGGGGPGSGPVTVSDRLLPFLPVPFLKKNAGLYEMSFDRPQSIGRVKAFYGNFGMFVRAWCYIRALGGDGLRSVSENAILNANYIKSQLKGTFHLPVEAPSLHEAIFNDKNQKDLGLDTTKIAKRLIDYGMHPPTVHFPLCVRNAIMIEPTETESLSEMDRFIGALKEVVETPYSEQAPVRVPREKVDETKAARELKLKA